MSETTTSSSTNTYTQAYPVVVCAADMEVLHQVSGQCWNDAFIVLLWFASGIGPYVQQALQDPSLDSKFYKWLLEEGNREKISKVFPEAAVYYTRFARQIVEYFKTLQLRFGLFLAAEGPKKIKSQIQRSLSQNYSLQLERSGIYASEYLTQTEEKECEYVEGMGFNLAFFSNIVYIFLKFLLDKRLNLLTLRTEDADFEKYLKMPSLFFIYDTFLNSKIHIANIMSIFSVIDSQHQLSFIASFWHDKDSSHAVTFLTCEDRKHYFFDDNSYKLTKINWPLLFKNIDYTEYILLYIPEYATLTQFLSINIASENRPAFLLLNIFNRQNEILVNKYAILTPGKEEFTFSELNKLESSEKILLFPMSKLKYFINAIPELYILSHIQPLICNFGNDIISDTGVFEPLNPVSYSNTAAITGRKQKAITKQQQKNLNIRKHIIAKNFSSLGNLLSNSSNIRDVNTALVMAIKENNLELVKYLVQLGAENKNIALIIAIKEENNDLVKLLIEMGADKSYANDEPLFYALLFNNYELAEYLLSLGADINARNGTIVLSSFNLEKLNFILKHGGDIHVQDEALLKKFIKSGALYCPEIILLIQSGADWRINSYEPIKIAVEESLKKMDERLLTCIGNAIPANAKEELQGVILSELNSKLPTIFSFPEIDIRLLKFLVGQGVNILDAGIIQLIKAKPQKSKFFYMSAILNALTKEEDKARFRALMKGGKRTKKQKKQKKQKYRKYHNQTRKH